MQAVSVFGQPLVGFVHFLFHRPSCGEIVKRPCFLDMQSSRICVLDHFSLYHETSLSSLYIARHRLYFYILTFLFFSILEFLNR